MDKESKKHRASDTLGGASKHSEHKKHKKKKVRSIHIRPGASGGFIAKHEMEPEGPDESGVTAPPEPNEHVIPDMEALKQHLQEHMGGNDLPTTETAPPAPPPDTQTV